KTLPYVSRWEKVDDFTVRVHTSEPAPTLWDALGREPLVPRAWTIKHGVDALNERPVGTGPWKLVEWKRKTSMLLERNETYWGTRTLARRLRLQVIPEASARLAALRAGQVSLVDAVPPLDATVLAREPAFTVVSGPQKLNCRLYLNGRLRTQYDSGGKDGLYGDTKTRLALTLGVNREAIINKIFQGYALANASPVATVSYGYAAQEPYPYDPKRARTLLAEAGWKDTGKGWEKNGEPLVLNLHYAAKHYGQAFDETTAAVAEMLKDLGVQVTLKPLDFGTILQITQKGTLPCCGGCCRRCSWSGRSSPSSSSWSGSPAIPCCSWWTRARRRRRSPTRARCWASTARLPRSTWTSSPPPRGVTSASRSARSARPCAWCSSTSGQPRWSWPRPPSSSP